MDQVSHAHRLSFVVNGKYFVVRKFIRQDAPISFILFVWILTVVLLDKQDATAMQCKHRPLSS